MRAILLAFTVIFQLFSSFAVCDVVTPLNSEKAPSFNVSKFNKELIYFFQSSDCKEIKEREHNSLTEKSRGVADIGKLCYRSIPYSHHQISHEISCDHSYFCGRLEILSSCPHPPTFI